MIKKLSSGKKSSVATKAEVKIIVVILYFTIMGIMGLMSISFYEFNNISDRLTKALLCENSADETNCEENLEEFSVFAILSVVAFAAFAFAPVVAILFSFNAKNCREGIKSFTTNSK